MSAKKILKRIVLIIVLVALTYAIYYCWVSFPIITGFCAKNAASSIFVAGRDEASVKREELGYAPLSLAKINVDYKDSSVSAALYGFAKRKAIYRKALGCTLINDLSEDEVRAEHFIISAPPNLNIDTLPWPSGDLVAGSFPSNLNKEKLQEAVQSVFEETDTLHKKFTRAVIVVYDGKIVAEQYAPGYNMHSKQLGWSMTKSVTAALTGILVKEGKLKTDMPAPVPEWKDVNDPRHKITIENILQQSTGLDFEENYQKSSDATKMLFEKGNAAAYTASRPLKYEPGTVFYYSSGNTNILSRIIRQTVGDKMYHRFPYDSFFYKIGMYSAVMEADASGTFIGSSYMYATARDWARFGLLYYYNGVWNGEQILPADWVKLTFTPAKSSARKEYGYQFWLNGFDAQNGQRIYPGIPADMFFADGYGGQRVYIIPSKKIVIVRLGLNTFN
ncbi:MAG: serine hydrolase, partial [Parafilimonas sp.]